MKRNALLAVAFCLFSASCGSDGGSPTPSTNLSADQTNAAVAAIQNAAGSALNQQSMADAREEVEGSQAPHVSRVDNVTVNCSGGGTMTVSGSATMTVSGDTLPVTFTANDISITVNATNCVTSYNGSQYTINSTGVTVGGNETITIATGNAISGTVDMTESGSFTVNSNSCSVALTADFTLATTGSTETITGSVSGTTCGASVTNTVSVSTTI